MTGLRHRRPGPPVPRVTGVLDRRRPRSAADLVVDCGGRRSALPALARGGRRPAAGRGARGLRLRLLRPALPVARRVTPRRRWRTLLQHYDSVTVLTLPADNGTWSVVLTTSAGTRRCAGCASRRPGRGAGALPARRALGATAEPITGVDVMAGIEDRYRRLVVDGEPVATGVVAVGDAWACTNPSLGRGASIGAAARPRAARRAARGRPGRPRQAGPPVRRGDRRGRSSRCTGRPLWLRPAPAGRDRRRRRRRAVPDRRPALGGHQGRCSRPALRDPDIAARVPSRSSSLLATPDEVFADAGPASTGSWRSAWPRRSTRCPDRPAPSCSPRSPSTGGAR